MSLGTDTLFWKERKGAMPEIPASGDLIVFSHKLVLRVCGGCEESYSPLSAQREIPELCLGPMTISCESMLPKFGQFWFSSHSEDVRYRHMPEQPPLNLKRPDDHDAMSLGQGRQKLRLEVKAVEFRS
jgi:hypothetical protein